jgi:DNA processing protein
MRNAVMSGLAFGTVVVEAGRVSGARIQARFALDHGKQLFLLRSLVEREPWAQKYAQHPATIVVDDVGDVLTTLDYPSAPRSELAL